MALRLPLAPGVAAPREGVTVDLERIAAAWQELGSRYSLLVTEGAGGLYVPIRDNDFLVLDMVRWLRLPLIVVARAGLGTINHTVLTVKAAQHAGVPVAGVVINRYPENPSLAEETNPEVIAALTDTPILARVPEMGSYPPRRQSRLSVCHGGGVPRPGPGLCRPGLYAQPGILLIMFEH